MPKKYTCLSTLNGTINPNLRLCHQSQMLLTTLFKKSPTSHCQEITHCQGTGEILGRTIKSVGKDVEKLEFSCTTGENIKCTATLENSLEIPEKLKHRVTI